MRMRPLFALVVLGIATAPRAQQMSVAQAEGCTLYAVGDEAVSGPFVPPQARLAAGSSERRVVTRAASTFDVTYLGFTAEAQAAFQRAVDIWAAHLASAVPIRVRASFSPLPSGTLGSAGPFLVRDVDGSGRPATWYPYALADAIAGRNVVAGTANDTVDVVAQFSSSRTDFYFGLDGDPGPGQFDFVTIVLHELGHGLGFIGSGDVDDGTGEAECSGTSGQGCWGFFNGSFSGFPYVFDRLITDGQGADFLNQTAYPNPSFALGNLLESQDLFVSSPEVVQIFGGPAPVWAPVPFRGGSSFSHWDENVVTAGTSAALMTPQVSRGEAYQDPGDITLALFQDTGWEIADGPTDAGAPPDAALSFVLAGPNPARGRTALRLRQAEPGRATIVLVDALGRTVTTLFDGAASRDVRVEVPLDGLAPGVYVALAETEGGSRSFPLSVVR